jgi:two-component system, OmpR family, response regulator
MSHGGPEHPRGKVADGKSQSVLVVDDDRELRESIRNLLIVSGFHALPARDGLEALKALDRQHVDALIVDLMMPRLDGVGLVRALVARPRRPRVVILITAYFEVTRGSMGLEVSRVFLKPFDPLELLLHLRTALGIRPSISARPPRR